MNEATASESSSDEKPRPTPVWLGIPAEQEQQNQVEQQSWREQEEQREEEARSKRIYKCRLCGGIGHNKLKCPLRGQLPSDAAQNKGSGDRRAYRCSVCGKSGHTKKSCLKRRFDDGEDYVEDTPLPAVSAQAKRARDEEELSRRVEMHRRAIESSAAFAFQLPKEELP